MQLAFLKREDTFFATLIRWWTHSKYDHCELIFSDGRMFSSRNTTGVCFRPDNFIPGATYWDFIDIPMTADEENIVRMWCVDEVGKAYDWLGIVLCQILGWHRESKDKWFCSEICLTALQQVGLYKGQKPYRFAPGDLYDLVTQK